MPSGGSDGGGGGVGGGGGGGGGGGCGGGGGFSGGGFRSYSSGYSGCSTPYSSSYNSYAGISATRKHVASQSHSSVSRADKSVNKEGTASQSNTHANADQSCTRETDQINKTVQRKHETLAKDIYLCVSTCLMCACLCCFISAFIVPFVVIGILGMSTTDIATNFFSPGDSRLISFSSFFCDGVDVEVDSVATVQLFFLSILRHLYLARITLLLPI